MPEVQILHIAGLLEALSIPQQRWTSISMDFINGLPKSIGKDAILVVVDRLSKYSHFVAIAYPFTAATTAQIFYENIFMLLGCLHPLSVIEIVLLRVLFGMYCFVYKGWPSTKV